MQARDSFTLRSQLYPEMAFGGFSRWDGTVAFYSRIASLLDASWRVLDYGCGAGRHVSIAAPAVRALQQLKGKVREVVGTDVAPEAATNPWIDRFVLLEDGVIPLESGTCDACIVDWTLEHVGDVDCMFGELARVLRPGGYLFIRTPNRWHYSSVLASLVPFRLHAALRRWLGQFHSPDDVFPVLYRCNTARVLKAALRRYGFAYAVHTHRGESHLAGAGRLWGFLGEFVERLSPQSLAHELHGFGRKAAGTSAGADGQRTTSPGQ